jgi:hypothetical protein
MKTIIVGFSTHKGNAIGADLIRKYMGTEFSHVFFKFKEEHYTDYSVFHAVGRGLSYVCETRFLKTNQIVAQFELSVSDETYYELLNDCHASSGLKYGYLQNLGILIVECLNKLGCKFTKNPINDGINCSEWVAYLLEEMYGEWTDKDYNLVTPLDVYNYLVKLQS